MLRADGSHYHLGVAAAPVRNATGEIIASVAILNDITQRKHDEERLSQLRIEAERANLAKSELLAILSHELRTPLNAILGFSELMQQEMFGPLENERYRDYVASIHNSGVYLHDLVNEVLDFARTDSGHMQIAPAWCEFGPLVESVLKMVQVRAESLDLTIVRAFEAPDLRVYSDDRAFKQMLFNLLTNAVKFNRPKGTITIGAGVAADGSLVVSVEDTGIGISPDDLQKVREPFQQGRAPAELARQGAGLGLALIDNLIELHGGRMTIESELGVGSKFTLYFPSPLSGAQGGEDSAA
jgi:signal transduction histidine kinase